MEEQNTDEKIIPEDEIDEPAVEEETEKKPALVINVHSWWTPIVGVIMLAVGLLGGYIIRPETNNPVSLNGSSGTNPTGLTNPPIDPNAAASRQEMMDFLVSQTRHMRGDPDAPVAMIEFSDFQ